MLRGMGKDAESTMITTVIFDLDGLLADTEKLHYKAYGYTFGELGAVLPEEEYRQHWIRKGKGILDYLEEQKLDLDINEVRALKKRHYDELVRSSVQPMPGALGALERLHGEKTLAIATASYLHSAQAVLETLCIEHYFDCVASKGDVTRAKPSPDIFLFAAEQLGVEPGECVVIEDAEKGILAAAAAGMLSIAVPNVHTADNDFSKATLVLESLKELTLETLVQVPLSGQQLKRA